MNLLTKRRKLTDLVAYKLKSNNLKGKFTFTSYKNIKAVIYLKLINCNGTPYLFFRQCAITACKSSIFFPVIRT